MRSTRVEAGMVVATTLAAGLLLGRIWTLPVDVDWVLADAGLILNTSEWILEGKLPWRDFGYWFGPLAPLLHAGAFAVFGERESVLRVLGALALAATAGGTYVFGRRALGRGAAAAAAFLTWLLLIRCLNIQYANVYCVPLAIWGLHLAAGGASRWRAVGAGLLGGLAFALKLNAGGAILATLWMMMLGPQGSRRLPATRRWIDPFWSCMAAFLAAVPWLTRGAGAPLTRLAFPLAAVLGCMPLAVAAVTSADEPEAGDGLRRRWGLGVWFLAGTVLAQAPWIGFYAPRVALGAFVREMAVQTMEFGQGVLPTPLVLPILDTTLILGAFVMMLLPILPLAQRIVAGFVMIGATIWYLRLLWMPVSPQRGIMWDNLGLTLPWFVLGVLAYLSWPRPKGDSTAQTWLRQLALALGCQFIVIYPVGDFGHMIYVAPFFVLGLIWLVNRGFSIQVAPPRLHKWAVAAGVVVPLAVLIVELEQRWRPWLRAWHIAGRHMPPAMQIAPPRANVWAPRIDAEPVRSVYDVLQEHPAVEADRLLSYPSPYFYWLTDTTSPTYLPYFWPIRSSESEDESEVSRLSARPPQIIAWRESARDGLFRPDRIGKAFPHVFTFVRDHYGVWQTIPPYHLLLPAEQLEKGDGAVGGA